MDAALISAVGITFVVLQHVAQTTGSEAVSLASIGLASTSVVAVIWLAKYFAKELTKDLKAHTKAAIQQEQASLKAANASEKLEKTVKKVGEQAELSASNSQEQLKFMRALNGKLAKATIQTVKEQNVEHQTVQRQDKE